MKNIVTIRIQYPGSISGGWVDGVDVLVWLFKIVLYYESLCGLNRREYQNKRTGSESYLKESCREIIQTVEPINVNTSQ